MDSTDYLILNCLQEDCKKTLRSIGEKVGLTPPAVGERIRKMEEEGVIRGYRLSLDRTRLDCGITGFIMVACDPERYGSFCSFCEKSERITEHSHVVGKYNAVLRFAVRDTNALDELLTSIRKYGDSLTSVELKSYFETKKVPVIRANG